MNSIQRKKLVAQYGEAFVAKHERWVCPTTLKKFDQVARQKGNLQDSINRYAGQFLNGQDQEVAISVTTGGANGNDLTVKDGVTRGKGKQQAHRSDPTQKVKISTFHQDVYNYTAAEWEDFQDASNDHLGENPPTENDLRGAVQRRIDNGRLFDIVKAENGGKPLDPTKAKQVKKYCNLGGEWFVRELFPNTGKTAKFFSNAIEAVLNKDGTDKIDTYDIGDLIEKYRDNGGTGYDQGSYKKWADIGMNGETVFCLKGNDRINPNLGGHFLNHAMYTPGGDYTLMIAYDKVLTKEGSDIINDRATAAAKFKKMYNGLKSSFKVTGRVRIVYPYQVKDTDSHGFTTLWDSGKSKVTIINPGVSTEAQN